MKKVFTKISFLLFIILTQHSLSPSALSSPSEPTSKRAKKESSPQDTLLTHDHGITQIVVQNLSSKAALIAAAHIVREYAKEEKKEPYSPLWLAVVNKDVKFIQENLKSHADHYFKNPFNYIFKPDLEHPNPMDFCESKRKEFPFTPLDLTCTKIQTKTDPYAHIIIACLNSGSFLSEKQKDLLHSKDLFPLYPWDLIEKAKIDQSK